MLLEDQAALEGGDGSGGAGKEIDDEIDDENEVEVLKTTAEIQPAKADVAVGHVVKVSPSVKLDAGTKASIATALASGRVGEPVEIGIPRTLAIAYITPAQERAVPSVALSVGDASAAKVHLRGTGAEATIEALESAIRAAAPHSVFTVVNTLTDHPAIVTPAGDFALDSSLWSTVTPSEETWAKSLVSKVSSAFAKVEVRDPPLQAPSLAPCTDTLVLVHRLCCRHLFP